MNKLKFKKATLDEFSAIAQLIFEQNQLPERHCIHSDVADDANGVLDEMIELGQKGEIEFVAAAQNKEIMGILGSEIDPEVGRGWLRGPFVLAEEIWANIAAGLFKALREALPLSIHRLDSFLNIKNERGNNFYQELGFKWVNLAHVYQISRPQSVPVLPDSCHPVNQTDEAAVIKLHDTLFPETFINGIGILEQRDEVHQIFVYRRSEERLGYIYVTIDRNLNEGYVEFLGVQKDARRQGIGRQLLQAGLHWFFQVEEMPQASLTVYDNLANARSLYESVGFKLRYTGVNFRQEW